MDPESGVGGEEPLRRTAYRTQANALFRKNLTFQVYTTGWYIISVTNLIRSKMITRFLLTSRNVKLCSRCGSSELMEGQPEQRYVLIWDKLWDLYL